MVVIAVGFAIAVFASVYIAVDAFLTSQFADGNIEKEQPYIDQLQSFIYENDLSMGDYNTLYQWVKSQKIVYLSLYENGNLIFDSAYTSLSDYGYELSGYNINSYYELEFNDGTAQAFIIVMLEYRYYTYLFIGDIVLSVLIFLGIFMYGVNKEVRYIKQLQNDVHLMESGTLDKPIEIRGKDELSDLAAGIEQMRISFRENIKTEQQLSIANKNLVSGMSHDLRTPLTSLIMYLELLRTKNTADEKDRYYIEKAYSKAMHIKELSDRIFEFFFVSRIGSDDKCLPESFRSVFEDSLSEAAVILTNKGFKINNKISWNDIKISSRYEFISRIIDNIVSNIIRYADSSTPVTIETIYTDTTASVKFINRIADNTSCFDSTKMGVTNINLMMNKLNGSYNITVDEETYTGELVFNILKNA